MGRARSMPCDISNYSNVSSDLGSWYLDVLLFFGFSRIEYNFIVTRSPRSYLVRVRPDTSGPERVERRLCMHGPGLSVEPFIACDALCSWTTNP